jgi:hypothetical protein
MRARLSDAVELGPITNKLDENSTAIHPTLLQFQNEWTTKMNQPMKRIALSALAVAFSLLQTFPVCAQDSQAPSADWREQYAYTLGV